MFTKDNVIEAYKNIPYVPFRHSFIVMGAGPEGLKPCGVCAITAVLIHKEGKSIEDIKFAQENGYYNAIVSWAGFKNIDELNSFTLGFDGYGLPEKYDKYTESYVLGEECAVAVFGGGK